MSFNEEAAGSYLLLHLKLLRGEGRAAVRINEGMCMHIL